MPSVFARKVDGEGVQVEKEGCRGIGCDVGGKERNEGFPGVRVAGFAKPEVPFKLELQHSHHR